MRLIITFVVIALISVSCKKEGASATAINETIDSTSSDLKFSGIFEKGPYGSASGQARVYLQNGMLKLALENFSVNNGPDLHVYLSIEKQPVNFISLGKLKATSGNQLYDITGMPDFAQYKYALIHCQQYNHLFGSAELK
jgi:hypothetical protein